MSTECETEEVSDLPTEGTNNSSRCSRRSFAGPMKKLMKRLSGMPPETGPPKTPRLEPVPKKRVSFQGWRHRRSTNRVKNDNSASRVMPPPTSAGLIRQSLLPNMQLPRHSITTAPPRRRAPLRAAPIAEPEEVKLSKEKKPRTISSAARRFSAITTKSKKSGLERKRVTEFMCAPSTNSGRRFSCGSAMSELDDISNVSPPRESPFGGPLRRSETVYLPPTDINGRIRNFSNTASSSGSAGLFSRDSQRRTPVSVFSDGNRTPTPSLPPQPLESQNTGLSYDEQIANAKKWSERLQASLSRAGRRKVIRAGKTLFNKSPAKGIEYLINKGIISDHPGAIASLLTTEDLSRQAIGEYLGRLSDPLAVKVTKEFVSRLDLRGLEVDEALRKLLAYVHPEGESQKIEFLLQTLKDAYIEQNREKVAVDFRDLETIAVLAYSVMMLHTGFYNPNVRRHARPMTREEFVSNNRGIDDEHDVPLEILEGIYKRVTASEFKSLPDLTDRLREVDQIFTGPLKPEKFVERHRRFVAWTVAYDVIDVTGRRPFISRTSSQLRGIFIFNDLLVIAKPLGWFRSNAVDELFGYMTPSQFPGDLAGGSRRLRSLDRLVGRMASPGPSITSPLGSESNAGTPVPRPKHDRSHSDGLNGIWSTAAPVSRLFYIRQIIPLHNVQVLVFESEHYKFGVQLRDDKSVLINLNLANGQIRNQFIDCLYGSMEETKELIQINAEKRISPIASSDIIRQTYF
ncbi:unnamed protein product [Mesocestoides corti]|uniref:SEC7 domain-containing protein n=2 Tax=Mesocestoides corti TaxID=53468 RepID=A0A0R3U4E6_MESCO|nr:unnamed protein product [Mesocestoides corti]